VVDDDEAVRRSLGFVLLSRGHAVQTFDSGEAFLASGDLQTGGCVILDLRMGGMSGLQVFRELHTRGSPLVVLFLSGHGDIPIAVEATKNGAVGWLEKPCSDEQLLHLLQEALVRADSVAQRLRRWRELTPREKEVAFLVAEGHPNKEIARRLVPVCGSRAVETHRAHLCAKLDIGSAAELATLLAQMRSWGFDLRCDTDRLIAGR